MERAGHELTAQQIKGLFGQSRVVPNCMTMCGRLLWIEISIIGLRAGPAAKTGTSMMKTQPPPGSTTSGSAAVLATIGGGENRTGGHDGRSHAAGVA